MNSDLISILQEIRADLKDIKKDLGKAPKLIGVREVATEVGLTPQAVRKRLKNGDFEPGVDFKHVGSRILIARDAVPLLQRRRK